MRSWLQLTSAEAPSSLCVSTLKCQTLENVQRCGGGFISEGTTRFQILDTEEWNSAESGFSLDICKCFISSCTFNYVFLLVILWFFLIILQFYTYIIMSFLLFYYDFFLTIFGLYTCIIMSFTFLWFLYYYDFSLGFLRILVLHRLNIVLYHRPIWYFKFSCRSKPFHLLLNKMQNKLVKYYKNKKYTVLMGWNQQTYMTISWDVWRE